MSELTVLWLTGMACAAAVIALVGWGDALAGWLHRLGARLLRGGDH